MDVERAISRFKQLGLTDYQSRVLYALLKKKSCKISDIASHSNVPNTRIYDVVSQLIDMKFVIKISDRPKTYRIRNVDQVLDTLLDEKHKEMQSITEDINMIKEYFKFDDNYLEENKLVNVDKNKDLVNILIEELGKAKKEIIGFGHKELEHKKLQESLRTLSNKVDIKLISHPDHDVNLTFAKSKHHDMCAYVVDNSKLILGLGESTKMYNLGLLHNQESLKNMVKNHFDTLWNMP